MRYLVLTLVYAMFSVSGAAALVYQVVWVRSLTLVFGGSHLAVTTVLLTFMAGLAMGGYFIGKYADHIKKPLRLYGLLELGIALFAAVFILLMKVYPSTYVFLTQSIDDSPLYLSLIRIFFSVGALIVPTTLMGGTLPVLSRFLSGHFRDLRKHLSFLYGFNTLGAALGAIVAGFFLLRFYSVSTALYVTILTNGVIGLAIIMLQDKAPSVLAGSESAKEREKEAVQAEEPRALLPEATIDRFPFRLVAWGIGASGFCALGYEVLWTRILAIVIGATVYSFTTMLAAFLTGIALGSGAYALWAKLLTRQERDVQAKLLTRQERDVHRSIFGFGIVQILIGITALLVSMYLRDLPAHVTRLYNYFQAMGIGFFGVRIWCDFVLAFAYMLVPAFFMGFAFPLAGGIHAEYKRMVGKAVGEVLAYNTVGAILGAGLSGLLLTYLFGIERSLQMLTVVNIGFGLIVLSSSKAARRLTWGILLLMLAALLFLAINHDRLRIWDTRYFAIFRSNQLDAFNTPERRRDAIENTEVLYYAEGAESIVSSIKVKGGEQSFITNGRVEASSHLQGQQHMFALSHLPMLLHNGPKRVLVVGLGSGMTLGAISVHPGLEELTLAEIEPKVFGVARTFEKYNHKVLDNPKVKIVFNDGRNFLLTTPEKYDVITADPIHPWFRGAGYLYTSEYFKLASDHLISGGILCQWLPIYELTTMDLKSIVKTFGQHFRHTLLFLTHYDAELIGSNQPIVIDEAALDRRIAAAPEVVADLKRVIMGSADDILQYFLMGTQGMKAFGKGGVVNTDDNLYLEFSAPFAVGKSQVMEENVLALIKHRETIMPYLTIPTEESARAEQGRKWAANQEAQGVFGPALALFLGGKSSTPEFRALLHDMDHKYPGFAPMKFLKLEYRSTVETTPTLIQKVVLNLLAKGKKEIIKEISAVLVPVSAERSAVVIVDNDAKVIYGQLYISGPAQKEMKARFVTDVMGSIADAYRKTAATALKRKSNFPEADETLSMVKEIVLSKVKEYQIEAEK
jgi:spermidine synthase